MILYRKGSQLRIRRSASPEPPFWSATTVAPYSARRATPIAIDYVAMHAAGAERLDVAICDDPRDDLDRTRVVDPPLLIDAAEAAETVFRRGQEILDWCGDHDVPAVHLVSTRGVLPARVQPGVTIAIAAWPLDAPRLSELFHAARQLGAPWGVAVPVVFPVTTELHPLERLVESAAAAGASFIAAFSPQVEPTAKQAIAGSLALTSDDDRYAMLFHAPSEPIQLATERHVAALATERGLADFVVPPRWHERSNWNAAVLLTLTASRMIAMELDLELAGAIARSARTIAALDKPLTRIVESATIGIIGGLDETSVEVLTEWVATGSASFVDFVNDQWRMRRA